jgi:hypothetical protein
VNWARKLSTGSWTALRIPWRALKDHLTAKANNAVFSKRSKFGLRCKDYGAKILLVEDEEKLARFVELELRYEAIRGKGPQWPHGLRLALSEQFDLIYWISCSRN